MKGYDRITFTEKQFNALMDDLARKHLKVVHALRNELRRKQREHEKKLKEFNEWHLEEMKKKDAIIKECKKIERELRRLLHENHKKYEKDVENLIKQKDRELEARERAIIDEYDAYIKRTDEELARVFKDLDSKIEKLEHEREEHLLMIEAKDKIIMDQADLIESLKKNRVTFTVKKGEPSPVEPDDLP